MFKVGLMYIADPLFTNVQGFNLLFQGFLKVPCSIVTSFGCPRIRLLNLICRSDSLALGLTEAPVVSLLSRCQKMATCRYLHHDAEVSDCRLDTSVEFRDCVASGGENALEANEAGFRALAPHYGVQTLVGILGSPHCAPLEEVHMCQTSVHILDMFCHIW